MNFIFGLVKVKYLGIFFNGFCICWGNVNIDYFWMWKFLRIDLLIIVGRWN